MTQQQVEVSKEQFFASVGQLNVHPRPERDRSVWVHCQTHETLGFSYPGYASAYGTPESFSVRADLLKAHA